MAKALALTPDALNSPQITPKASTPPRTSASFKPVVEISEKSARDVSHPLQIRIPREKARAIKIAAAERDMTLSEFMLACFHTYMEKQ